MPEFEFINYSVKNQVATIALNTPQSLNAFHQKMRLELISAVEYAESDQAARVVILTGEGRAFSAGADLKEDINGGVHASFFEQCEAEYTPWLMGIYNSKKIYMAAVNGACAGIGSAAALNCDLIVMADDAYLYQAFAAIGLMPDGGATWSLLQKLGYQRAFEMAVDAGKLTAQQCLDDGIANRVVSAQDLMAEAQAWAERLALGAPLSQAYTKQLMRKAPLMSYQDVVVEESRLQAKLIQSEDSANAIKAFFAKEKPVFKGK
ncbi:MAG: enoyl-CoA hydratase/isomerase family protein [Acidiferrobacterales bacterium]|nr:enoyl-CoA hydratase/isomerase family protein [Acidiferrobacterales bacterium]